MATNKPYLIAIRGALDELRRAPLLEKPARAETVATLTLTLLVEFDRRLGELEARRADHDARLAFLASRLDGVAHELARLSRQPKE